MSYEGYERVLCANGHEHVFNCYDVPQMRVGKGQQQWDDKVYSEDDVYHCIDCGELVVWWEGVDETNGMGVKTVLKEHKPAQTETCECCGHVKVVSEEQYCIPSNQGHRLNTHVEPKVPLAECSSS